MFDTNRPKDDALSPAEEELLRKRARAYAKPLVTEVEPSRDAVVFIRGGAKYACPLSALREIRTLGKLCRMPLASAIVPGAVHVRGEIVSVHDLAAFLSESVEIAADASLLVVEDQGDRLALVADEVIGVDVYHLSALRPLPLTLGERASCFQGMLADGTMLLSSALFSNTEFSSAY